MPNALFPPGRLVYGHPSQKIHKKDNKKQPMFKADGTAVMVHSFGVAYPKDVFNYYIRPVMESAASAAYGGQPVPPHFAYKYKDGDGVDRQGKPYNTREGYAGHYVVHFETQFDLLAYRLNPQTNGWDQITANDYKTGDYIQVNTDVEGNKPTDPSHTPGLFVNPKGVLHVGNGPAIVNAPSADQMFTGSQQFQLPPGASAPGAPSPIPANAPNPPGFGGGMPPGAMAPPVAPVAPQYQPAPAAAPVYAQPAPPVAQVPGFAPQPPQFQTPATGYMPQPAAPVAPQPVYAQPPGALPQAPVYPPAHDIVQNVTGAAPQYQPQPPAPAMPGQPAYAQPPVPGAPPAYPMTPGQVPGQ
jgi:hypothetical protein